MKLMGLGAGRKMGNSEILLKEALTKDRRVIPGLYAAGDIIAAEFFGDPPTNEVGNLSMALTTGLITGESALEYLKIK